MTPLTKSADPAPPTSAESSKRKRSISAGSSGSESESSSSDSSPDAESGDEDISEQALKPVPEPVAEPVQPKKPCHAFVKSGRCKNGTRCRFSHLVSTLTTAVTERN